MYITPGYKLRFEFTQFLNNKPIGLTIVSYYEGKQYITQGIQKADTDPSNDAYLFYDLSCHTIESIVVYFIEAPITYALSYCSVTLGKFSGSDWEVFRSFGASYLASTHRFSWPDTADNMIEVHHPGLLTIDLIGVAPITYYYAVPVNTHMRLIAFYSNVTCSAAAGNRYSQLLIKGVAVGNIARGINSGAVIANATVDNVGFIGNYYYNLGSTLSFVGFPSIWMGPGTQVFPGMEGAKAGDVVNSGALVFEVLPWKR